MKKDGVICAIDVEDFDQNVIDLAATYAKHFGKELDLIHVSLFPDPANAAWPGQLGASNILINDNRKLRKIISNIPDLTIHYHHLSGDPAEKILEFAERNEPRLLVLGTHGRKGLARIFGSVATKIMRLATCPVLILRQQQNSDKLAQAKTGTIE